ncbi:hypothetical protein [Parvibaculum sp.]|uniref:hypothetical protein n=1 Tax=Parvibaculum sp. TaxID=2024848 RepID=UPI003BAB59F8
MAWPPLRGRCALIGGFPGSTGSRVPGLRWSHSKCRFLDDDGRVNMILVGSSHFTVGADWGVARRLSWPMNV